MTIRELITARSLQMETFDQWIERIYREQREAEFEQARQEQIAEDVRTGQATYFDMPDDSY